MFFSKQYLQQIQQANERAADMRIQRLEALAEQLREMADELGDENDEAELRAITRRSDAEIDLDLWDRERAADMNAER